MRRQRLLARADARDRSKLEDWDNYLKYYADEAPPCFDHVFIEGDG
ncbi:hypothetical protein [uncultured Desulfosarcina sp.]|nr:hypothetical protein [uncultured Desulfosarcina sp.]